MTESLRRRFSLSAMRRTSSGPMRSIWEEIGMTVMYGEFALTFSDWITKAGRIFLNSSPTLGLKRTRQMSPNLIFLLGMS